jgi:hypothetical protein
MTFSISVTRGGVFSPAMVSGEKLLQEKKKDGIIRRKRSRPPVKGRGGLLISTFPLLPDTGFQKRSVLLAVLIYNK